MSFGLELYENKLARHEPTCISERESLNRKAVPLTDEQQIAAKNELINMGYTKLLFPRFQKNHVDKSIRKQNFFIMYFVPSKDAIPDKDGVFGVARFRGAFDTIEDATEYAEGLILEDTYHVNDIGYVGKDFPICFDGVKYIKETKEVDIRSKLENSNKEHVREERKKEKMHKEQIEERQRKLEEDTSKGVNTEDLEYYTVLRQKLGALRMRRMELENKMAEATFIIEKTVKEINELDAKFPDYYSQYEEKYRKGLEEIGMKIGKEQEVLIQKMKDARVDQKGDEKEET